MPEERVTAQQRQAVAERAGHCCEYCQSQARFSMQSFSIEHVLPLSRGGETKLENLALACQGCNNAKYTKVQGRDPATGDTVPLYHPRQQRWSEHFAWNQDFTIMIGLTPVGRATIEELRLNREGLVRLRAVLYKMGEHPPETDLDDEE
jgi:hypothetical protein